MDDQHKFSRNTSPASAEAMRVLIVDDDPDCRELVREIISEISLVDSVIEACDGESALEVLKLMFERGGSRPVLIMLDLEMPKLNGLEALRRMREDPRLRSVPIVMMTGVDDPAAMRIAAEYGANSYTVKPSDASAFIEKVRASTTYWLEVHEHGAVTRAA
jgi:CheY-like chemotaxis protein